MGYRWGIYDRGATEPSMSFQIAICGSDLGRTARRQDGIHPFDAAAIFNMLSVQILKTVMSSVSLELSLAKAVEIRTNR
jgi:hypothetical protein